MDEQSLKKIIAQGETMTIEFKSWIKADSIKERINLVVPELIAFANSKGGTVYLGIEDSGDVTGCFGRYDLQNICEAIYDKTRPPMFTDIEEIDYQGQRIIAISVTADGNTYATTDGRCLKRLGKNSKPYYPDEMSHIYSASQTPDFSSQIIAESSVDDINLMVVYSLKEKLKIRDADSTLPELDDMAFLRDLGLITEDNGQIKLTIAGLLFVGKDASIQRLLPQAEVIYLHYDKENLEEYNSRLDMKQPIITILDRLTEKVQNDNKIQNVQIGLFRLEIADFSEKVFQEALLNALSHRDYQQLGAVYVKHYPDKIVIENPGGFPDGITERNIITHPSVPRNKLIAETLQRLKYVQRTGQGVDIIFREMVSMGKPYPIYRVFNDAVQLTIASATEYVDFVKFIVNEQDTKRIFFSLSELMILRYVADNRQIRLDKAQELAQVSEDEVRKSLASLIKYGLLETSGKDYMLTARVYEAVKSDVEYTRDKVVQYIRAKGMILEYLKINTSIKNAVIRELCGFTKQQARTTIDKMLEENLILRVGAGSATEYKLK
ncbi:MAG: putative DNA binding domain-containing protein [Clostridium sp.]|nr:putative DNA binding domain-containing protein [Clostridium sp.]